MYQGRKNKKVILLSTLHGEVAVSKEGKKKSETMTFYNNQMILNTPLKLQDDQCMFLQLVNDLKSRKEKGETQKQEEKVIGAHLGSGEIVKTISVNASRSVLFL